jgi:hypothetical protein
MLMFTTHGFTAVYTFARSCSSGSNCVASGTLVAVVGAAVATAEAGCKVTCALPVTEVWLELFTAERGTALHAAIVRTSTSTSTSTHFLIKFDLICLPSTE